MTDPTPNKQHGGKRPGAGRPKQHASSTARQVAYRQRRKAEVARLALELLAIEQRHDLTQSERDSLTSAAQLLRHI